MHSAGKPHVNTEDCIAYVSLLEICAHQAAVVKNRKASIDHTKCVGCGRCIGVCPQDAVKQPPMNPMISWNRKIAEYSKAVIDGRPNFPYQSCHGRLPPPATAMLKNDIPIVPDVEECSPLPLIR